MPQRSDTRCRHCGQVIVRADEYPQGYAHVAVDAWRFPEPHAAAPATATKLRREFKLTESEADYLLTILRAVDEGAPGPWSLEERNTARSVCEILFGE